MRILFTDIDDGIMHVAETNDVWVDEERHLIVSVIGNEFPYTSANVLSDKEIIKIMTTLYKDGIIDLSTEPFFFGDYDEGDDLPF